MDRKLVIVSVFLAILAITLLAAGCKKDNEDGSAFITKKYDKNKDITEVDIFENYNSSNDDFDSREVNFKGVKLGTFMSNVIELLGPPDNRYDMPEQHIINFEYNRMYGTNYSSLVVHFENGTVTRWTVYVDGNHMFHGNTIINRTKRQVIGFFGLPDRVDTSAPHVIYMYNEGFDIILNEADHEAISFIDPDKQKIRTIPVYATQKPITINPKNINPNSSIKIYS